MPIEAAGPAASADEDIRRRIEYLVTHDELTGLPNRVLFGDRIEQAIGRAETRDEQIAVMFVDLDEFKLVNDALGHAIGDELLRIVAARLRDCVRGGDTVARLGGDEFALLVEHTHAADAETLARRVVDLLAEPLVVSGRILYVGASLGVGLYPRDGTDAASLQQAADVAMYAAKAKGKRTYHFYTGDLGRALDHQLQLEMGLPGPSSATSCACSTSRRSIWSPARSLVSSRWCAGSVRAGPG
jgi:two-component system CheB/CheR fusion protein